jgi:hypothetical protein
LAVLQELRKNDDKIKGDSRTGSAYKGRDSLELGLASRALTQTDKERGIAATKATVENPELTKMLTEYICDIVGGKEFMFSSILITKHSEYGLHVDSKNVGRSVVITLGDHEGGEIWQASAEIDGQEIPGGPIFAHNEPHYFDGNIPHCTLPFEGERYSIIAYLTNTADSEKFADEDRDVFDQFGFRIPDKGEKAPRPRYVPAKKDARLAKAKPEHEKFLKEWNEQTNQEKRSRKRGGKASAGFVNITRGIYRKSGGTAFNGEQGYEQRTCLVDAVGVCIADQVEEKVNINYVRSFVPEQGDTSIKRANGMAKKFDMMLVSAGDGFSCNAQKTLQITSGHHVILVRVKHDSGDVDNHAMALTERDGEMHLVDNRVGKSIAMITDEDRADQWSARGVFYNMLRDASVDKWFQAETFRVDIRSVWSVVPWVPKAKRARTMATFEPEPEPEVEMEIEL